MPTPGRPAGSAHPLPLGSTLGGTLLAALALGSCGGATAALFQAGDDSGGNAATVVGDVRPAGLTGLSPVAIEFRLTDAESDPADVRVSYRVAGGAPAAATLVGPGLQGLASSPDGTLHTRGWDFAADLPAGTGLTQDVRLEVEVLGQSASATSAALDLGNDPPELTTPAVPGDEPGGVVPIVLRLSDSSGDAADVSVEFEDVLDGQGFRPASGVGTDLSGIVAPPAGVDVVFLWDTLRDRPGLQFSARLRFTAHDGLASSTPVVSDVFILDNNAEPLALLDGSAFFATPDERRGIPIPVRLIDAEGDPARVVVQWTTPFEPFPPLPGTPAELELLLADPVARRAARIASERAPEYFGDLVPLAPDVARLPQLADTAAVLAPGSNPGGLVGRRLDLLRGGSAPVGVAASWSANPLTNPIDVAGGSTDTSLLVLEDLGSGWRLVELEAGSGVVARTLAEVTAARPAALDLTPDRRRALVADELAGAWRLVAVDLVDGATSVLLDSAGALPGTPAGLAASGSNTALLSIGSNLVAVDGGALAPTWRVLIDDLQGPAGLAFDAARPGRVYLAERDWVDPATSNVTGRVARVELASRALETVVAGATPFDHAQEVALERGGARLLVLTDLDPHDGTRELRALDLGSSGAGEGFELASGLPDSARGLAAGALDLRALALPAESDLALSGGILSTHTIRAFDPSRLEAELSPALPPGADAGPGRWRIRDLVGRGSGATEVLDTFVWDSGDLKQAAQVVLRAVAYDSELGLATRSGVPRSVRSGIDVVPAPSGGPGSTSGMTALDLADLDGDGDLDLATANASGDSLTIFFQDGPRGFPVAPDRTLSGVPGVAPLLEPVSVESLDVDGDGDLDLVSANRGSHNFSVFRQTLPGVFTTELLNFAGGVLAPSDITGGDLNGDGRQDLVLASSGNDRLALFYQDALGLFPLSASLLLGDATTGTPRGVAACDLDGDGDLDLAAANEGTHNVSLFLQSAPGVFPSAPDQLLGGPGETDAPRSIAAGDVDGDGRPDLVVADAGGNDVALFRQDPGGGFPTQPSARLSAQSGPIAPEHVSLADVNDDGALDIVATSATDDLVVFLNRGGADGFSSAPLEVSGLGALSTPRAVAADDIDGDGFVDLVAANSGGDDASLFYQATSGRFASGAPDLSLGSATTSPGASAVVAADYDGDGDLDLLSASPGDASLTIFEQFSPALFGVEPARRIGPDPLLAGATSLAAADLDGDRRTDLVVAARDAGSLVILPSVASGTYDLGQAQVLGSGTLVAPAFVAVADLDGDGWLDLACADETGGVVGLWFASAPGTFTAAPSLVLGNLLTTPDPVHLACADLDGDGDLDLAVASRSAHVVAVFFQDAPRSYPTLPQLVLGGLGSTDAPAAVVAADLDGDGDIDLASANSGSDSLTAFLQSSPGSFPAVPDLLLTHAGVGRPATLAAHDVDADGDIDLVSGNDDTDNLTLFRQNGPGRFASRPEASGGAASTASPRSLAIVDLDGDGDLDLIAAQPDLDRLTIFFGTH